LWDEEEEVRIGEEKEGSLSKEAEEEEEMEELDYDETMEDLDLHPTGNIDDGEGDETGRLNVTSDERPGTVSWGEIDEEKHKAKDVASSGIHSDEQTTESTSRGTGTTSGAVGDQDDANISSPIRVSPDGADQGMVKHGPRDTRKREDKSRLSVKERLYVSRNTIEEKKWRLSHHTDDTSSKLPQSLANRLGPSPGRVGRKLLSCHKGSALAIAAEYKRRRQAGELSPREAARASRITMRINAPNYKPGKHQEREEKSEENERELDKKIDSIKRRNKVIEKRHKEIQRDKELHA
jgi:hypothetical protein